MKNEQEALGDPIKIGVLLDMPRACSDQAEGIYNLLAEQYVAKKRFERGFEFVRADPCGPPAGSIHATIEAFHELCDKDCLAVIGCSHSGSSIAIPAHADARKVPLISLGATARGMSDWTFSVCRSSVSHNAYAMASWLKQQGHKRIAVTWDRADDTPEYLLHFRNAVERAGLQILVDVRLPQLVGPELSGIFEAIFAQFWTLKPDALAHFGTGRIADHWANFVNDSGWTAPRIMGDAASPERVSWPEGWVGVTTWDDDNKVASKVYDDYRVRYPDAEAPKRELIAVCRDGLTALIEGIIQAPILTRDGIRRGLELVQMLPAASGGPRTCLGFSPHNHRGLQGPDVMVLRRMQDGQPVMEGRIQLF